MTIHAGNAVLGEAEAKLHETKPGEYVRVSVTDTGGGMVSEVMEHVFEPFFTTKPPGQGTGLGLSMVYGFARQSNGHTRIESGPGRGTTVHLYLPRQAGARRLKRRMPDTVARAADGAEGRVVVVDDEPAVHVLAADVLRDLGYEVIEAADGSEGLRVLQSERDVDLLISDVGLPGGMNGRQLADAARLQRPQLKILLITGFIENLGWISGELEPDMQVLTKPFALGALTSTVKAMLC